MKLKNCRFISYILCAVLLLAGTLTGCGKADNDGVTVKTTQSTVHTTESPIPTETTLPETTQPPIPESDSDFVKIVDYAPTIKQELRYATTNNFTGKVIYRFTDAYLRYGTLKKLIAVQEELAEHGVGIYVWDAFRPISGQQALWDAYPDPAYVSNPASGSSPHCKGNTVDITLYDLTTGELLEMPTGFDDFSTKASRDYTDDTETARRNAQLLEDTMEKHGFTPYYNEWWHYQDSTDYSVEHQFDPAKIQEKITSPSLMTTESATDATVVAFDTLPAE